MSLINDALKRAQGADNRPQARPPGPALVPALESLPRSGKRQPIVFWLGVCGVVAAVSTAAVWLATTIPTQHNRTVAAINSPAPTIAARSLPVAPAPGTLPSGSVSAPVALTAPRTTSARSAPPAPPRVATANLPVKKPAAVAPISQHPPALAPSASPESARIVAVEAKAAPPQTAFHLDAIHYRLKKPTAEINNTTLGVGQEISGAKVLAIERYQVRLLLSGKTFVLSQL